MYVHYCACLSTVLCTPGFGATVDPAQYGTTTLPILLDDVKCSGDESNLLSCPQLPINSTHNCKHSEDVAIQCTGMHVYRSKGCTDHKECMYMYLQYNYSSGSCP